MIWVFASSPGKTNRGYNIGIRLVDDFLAKTNTGRCRSFKDAARTIAEVGFKMFLGITAKISQWNDDETECRMVRSWVEKESVYFIQFGSVAYPLLSCFLACIHSFLSHSTRTL